MDDSIAAVHNAVRYVRASPSRLARFQSCVKNTSKGEGALVCLDVATRLNSTFMMLDRALKYVDAFKLLEEEDVYYMQYFSDEDRNGRTLVGPANSKDWENCVTFCRLLLLFPKSLSPDDSDSKSTQTIVVSEVPKPSVIIAVASAKPTKSKVVQSMVPRVVTGSLSYDGEVEITLRHLRDANPIMAPLIDMHQSPTFDNFHTPLLALTRSILYKQLAFKAGTSFYTRSILFIQNSSVGKLLLTCVLSLYD
uniref:Uncharacterized protein n=1 Tax=Cannabis sativa TaxID=3483 RepID=A0A803QNL2_CANSA